MNIQLYFGMAIKQLRISQKISQEKFALHMYMPAGESTPHGVLVHGFRSCSALFPVC